MKKFVNLLTTFILLIIYWIIAATIPSLQFTMDIASIVTVISWFIINLKFHKTVILANIYFFLSLLATLSISLILELNIFLVEVQEMTYQTGLPTRASIQVFLLLAGLSLGYDFFNRHFTKLTFSSFDDFSNKIIDTSIILFCLLFTVILLCIYLINGIPIFADIHRQDYWAGSPYSWGATLVNALIQFSLGFGFLYQKSKNNKYLYILAIILVMLFLSSVRFTGLITTLLLFFTPTLILNPSAIKLINKKFLITFSTISVIVGIGISLGFQSMDDVSSSQRILTRLSLQPQMWWMIDRGADSTIKSLDLITKSYLGFDINDKNTGPYYFMFKFAPTYIANNLYETQSTFTSIGVFNHVYFFGYLLGGFINFLYGILLSFFTWFFVNTLKSNNLIMVLISFRLIYLLQIIIVSGTNYQLISLSNLSLMIFAFILTLMTTSKERNTNYA